ncbi:MAG: hypothetical protein LBE81_03175 [Azonexus sp.]|jgi:hypothetical protein|uniref:hypothetical protein n=1 Tax=Azonexus sp. TaxID=1872668 RepID=UPI002838840B|nr:hypothetical protein [Azonexus sp.]MDR0775624.1 hypothetical protein [Azonexus sp.]
MDMRIASELTTKPVHGVGEDEVPTSEVLIHGTPTGKLVSGKILEAAVQWENRYLLFMTDDVPFEEMLSIHLLDAQMNALDSARIGCLYSTGTFTSLLLSEPNTVQFRFIGDTFWSIELLSRPRFRVPFISEPSGVWRSLGFSRHFIVHGNPRPQTVERDQVFGLAVSRTWPEGAAC